MKHLFVFLFSILIVNFCIAQELNVKVNVQTPKLKIADPAIFESFERNVTNFFNQTKWTDDEFENEERIEANIQITIKDELSAESFVADIWFTSIRPVFNSNYQTQIVNYIDKGIRFQYRAQQPIENSKSNFVDNLSSILTFYAFIMIAMDYDSFSPLGGDPYFRVAQNVLSDVPTTVSDSDKSWQAVGGGNRNRYWLLENMMSPRSRDYREAIYKYHRLGLDKMTESSDESKTSIISAIESIQLLERDNPNSMIVQMFTDSKRGEIIEIFKEATKKDQNEVYKLMSYIDPARASDYGIFK